MGAVKLWPADTHLVVGEGIETVLAAALMVPDEDGRPLRPAWALVSTLGLERLPEALFTRSPALEQLVVLVETTPPAARQPQLVPPAYGACANAAADC